MYQLKTYYTKILADTITPVSIYLKVRDKFPNSILLESSDYHANDNSFSYICCNPIASIKIENDIITQKFPDGNQSISETINTDVTNEIHKFTQQFKVDTDEKFKFINNGIFGYTAYDAVKYFEDIEISKKEDSLEIPDIYYAVYQNIIAINHFKNEAYIFAHCYKSENNVDDILHLIKAKNFASYQFSSQGEISSNLTDDEYKEHVELAKKHCARGDVFQLVLSKKFQQDFQGDEFTLDPNDPDEDTDPELDEDDQDVEDIEICDLALINTIADLVTPVRVGDTVKYEVIVVNQGNVGAESVDLNYYLPNGLNYLPVNDGLDPAWDEETVGELLTATTAALAPGESDTLCLYLQLDNVATDEVTEDSWTTVAEITEYIDENCDEKTFDVDSNPDDNPTNDPGGNPGDGRAGRPARSLDGRHPDRHAPGGRPACAWRRAEYDLHRLHRLRICGQRALGSGPAALSGHDV